MDTMEKEFSERHIALTDGREIVIMYDCPDRHVDKAQRRWIKGLDLSGESLCREIHRINPDCIAVTRRQFLDVISKAGYTEEQMGKRRVGTKFNGQEN